MKFKLLEAKQEYRYIYSGPVWKVIDENKIYVGDVKNVFTNATSVDRAYANILYSIKNQFGLAENAKIIISKNLVKQLRPIVYHKKYTSRNINQIDRKNDNNTESEEDNNLELIKVVNSTPVYYNKDTQEYCINNCKMSFSTEEEAIAYVEEM